MNSEQYLNTEFFLECDLNFVDMSKLDAKETNEKMDEVISKNPLKKVTTLSFKCLKIV